MHLVYWENSVSINLNQTNFGIRLKKDIGEKLHNFIEQRRGNRNALFNHAIAQYLEGQSNKETSEVE